MMGMRVPAAFLAAALCAALTVVAAGCGAPARFVASAPGEDWVRTELAFGLSTNGRAVTPAEWQAFLDEVVTSRFPEGFTVVDAYGQWRNAAGKVTAEPSKVLVIFHRPDPTIDARIEEIRSIYKRTHGQESVLRATSLAKTSF